MLQKVFTKDRLKAILLQEEEEDQTKVQNLQQDLEGTYGYWCVYRQIKIMDTLYNTCLCVST